MTFDELVAGVLDQGGFDVADSVAGGWVNEVHKSAVAEAEWQQQRLSLGVTVADQAQYDIPGGAAEIVGLYLADDRGNPGRWQRITTTQMWDLQAGRQQRRGSGGVFCPQFGSAGEKRIELYPAPVTDGVEIVSLAAMVPATMTSGMSPVIPEDFHGDLMDGAIALGLLRIDERADSAAVFEAKKDRMVARLKRRKNKRLGSRDPRLKLRGHDW